MKNMVPHTLALTALLCLGAHTLMAAAEHERSVTITINNTADRQIVTMPTFNSINVTDTDRTQGYVEADGGNMVVNSNASYKVQGKIIGNSLPAKLKIGNGSLTSINENYTDLLSDGVAASGATYGVRLRFDVDWSSNVISGENSNLYLKVLSRI